MSQVELVMTGYSIIVALCLARLLDALRPAAVAGARYWVHYAWVIIKIMNILVLYWATWAFLDQNLTFALFILILAPPSIVYLQCDALLSKSPDDVESWYDHFYDNRRFFFFANAALAPVIIAQLALTGGAGVPTPVYALLALLAVVSLAGALIANPRVQSVIAVLALLNITAGFTAQLTAL